MAWTAEHRRRPTWRRRGRLTWSPGDIGWRTAMLFMIGSACFALGAFPPFTAWVPTAVVGVVFFVGSLFFTAAGYSQFVQSINKEALAERRAAPGAPSPRLRLFALQPHRVDWWACVVQSLGTLWFNINTFAAMHEGLTVQQQNVHIWAPDYIGSLCFLFASELALWEACGRPVCVCRGDTDWWIAIINMVGSIWFMIYATAAFVVPSTSSLLDAAKANSGTFFGAVCFFWAARLLIKEDEEEAHDEAAPAPGPLTSS